MACKEVWLLLLLIGSAVQILASYHNISQSSFVAGADQHRRLSKRWYGVKPFEPNVPTIDQGRFGPWPPDEDGHHPLRYCFEDPRSAERLGPIVEEAVSRWHDATTAAGASSLSIVRSNKNNPICDDKHEPDNDALHIKDDTKDESDEDTDAKHWNTNQCSTQTTVGYDYHGTSIGRNSMKFCEFTPGASRTREKAPIYMTHELGHAMGLAHEHQRPDRDKYIRFVCSNIEGWDRAKMKQILADDEAGIFANRPKASNPPQSKDLEIRTRIDLVCNTEEGASAYFPRALELIRGNYMVASDERWRNYARSTPFDFESIMIYDTDSMGKEVQDPKDPSKKTYKWVIYNKDESAVSQRLHMGGKVDGKGGISKGDIARIAQLYPLVGGENSNAQDMEEWPQAAEEDEHDQPPWETA